MIRITIVMGWLVSTALIVGLPSAAEANDTECVGVLTGTFDNVIVPPGATCNLTNAVVFGNVKALEDSRLRISRSTVGGNVEGTKADIVQIFFSSVRENILIKEGGPAAAPAPLFNVCGFGIDFTPCEALIVGTTVEFGGIHIEKMVGSILMDAVTVRGNVKVEQNVIAAPELLFLQNVRVDENLQVLKNTGSGNKMLQGNRVGQNLQCSENDPPFVAAGNMAAFAEGQCAP